MRGLLPANLIACVLASAAACGGRAGVHAPQFAESGPQLPPPPPMDSALRGATYLNAIAAQVQPAWGQFLEDCRLRLSKTHPLNEPTLVAIAELTIARDGRAGARIVTGSGNGDFDTAVFDVLGDATPMPAPPQELASDDGLVHVRWTFARDGRQAGAATAQLLDVQLPLLGVVERMLAIGGPNALSRAAARIAASPANDPDRLAATERLMIAVLREGLASSNGAVRRAAIEAVGRANVHALAGEVHALAGPSADLDLRIVAIVASAALRDPAVVPTLVADLPGDFASRSRVVLAKVEALVTLGRGREASAAIRGELASGPSATGLAALALVPDRELAPRLATWFGSKDARTRAAVCNALPAAAPDLAQRLVTRGLRDADASVRASCTEATVRGVDWLGRDKRAGKQAIEPGIVRRLRELVRDRDRTVRARAIAALGVADPSHKLRAIDDPAPEVRVASVVGASEPELRTLAGDRDPDVRAAALASLGDHDPELVSRAASDLSAPVRKVAISVLANDGVLERMATDDSPEVATAALVKLASRRGRAAVTTALVGNLATANGTERVRIALAWLLAR
jgi:hypothetical protein